MEVKERLITGQDVVTVLRRYFLLIIAVALVFGAAGYLYAVKTTTVTYTATSSVYVQTHDVDLEVGPTANQISLARALALSCKTAIKNEAVYKNVKLYFAEQRKTDPSWEDLSSVSNATLRAMVVCNVENSSQHADIVVTAPTASLAVHLANAIAGVLEVSVIDVIGNCRIDPTAVARSATMNSDFSSNLALTLAIVGAFLSFCALFAMYFFNPYVRVSDISTCYDGVSVLGNLCVRRRGKKADALSSIRANLLFRTGEIATPILLLAPVSAKTKADLLPLSLATSFADTGRRVLLINGMTEDEGNDLADAVAGKHEAIRRATAHLSCLSFSANADLLGSREFAAFLSGVRAEYDTVLICTAPVQAEADAVTVAPLADGVLVATTPGKDKRTALTEALLSLSDVNAKLLGTVVTDK